MGAPGFGAPCKPPGFHAPGGHRGGHRGDTRRLLGALARVAAGLCGGYPVRTRKLRPMQPSNPSSLAARGGRHRARRRVAPVGDHAPATARRRRAAKDVVPVAEHAVVLHPVLLVREDHRDARLVRRDARDPGVLARRGLVRASVEDLEERLSALRGWLCASACSAEANARHSTRAAPSKTNALSVDRPARRSDRPSRVLTARYCQVETGSRSGARLARDDPAGGAPGARLQ